jgi:hypothetical protein
MRVLYKTLLYKKGLYNLRISPLREKWKYRTDAMTYTHCQTAIVQKYGIGSVLQIFPRSELLDAGENKLIRTNCTSFLRSTLPKSILQETDQMVPHKIIRTSSASTRR